MSLKKIIAAGGLVVNEKDEILFIYRRKRWDLPKGKLDALESIETCAVREVQEETGIKSCILEKFICKTHHQYFDKWLNDEVIKETWWYLMKSNSTEVIKPQIEEDIEEIIWANQEAITKCLSNTFTNILEVIEAYKNL